MADNAFGNDSLPDPQRQFAPYGNGGGSNDPWGGVISGLGGIAGAYAKRQGETARAEGGNDLTKQISDVILDKAGQASSTPLVGQGSGDSAQDAGAASPTGQALGASLNRIKQADTQGAYSTPLEKMTRINSLVQDAVNKDPLHADYYRGLAKDAAGVTPTAYIMEQQEKASEFTQGLNQEVFKTNVNAAAGAGITILKPDGTPDLQAMGSSGAKLLMTEKDTELKLKAAQLDAAQQKPLLSHEEQVSQEVNTVMGGFSSTLEQVQGSLFDNLPKLVQKYGAAGDNKALGQLAVDLNNNEAQTVNYVQGQMIKLKVSPEAQEKVISYVRNIFDTNRSLFGDPKTPLDVNSTNAKTLAAFTTNQNLKFNETAPVAAKVKAIVGSQGIVALFGANLINDPNIQTGVQTGVSNYLNSKPTALDAAHAATGAMTGDYDVSKEQRPAWQAAATAGVVRTVNQLVKTPDKLTPEQQTAFGHSMVQIANVALNDKSPKNLESAASIVNNPAAVHTFLNFAKNENNAGHAPIVALGMSSLLYQHVVSARQTLAQGANMTVTIPQAPNPNQNGFISRGAGLGPNNNLTVTGGAVYNPQSGQVEFSMTAVDGAGKKVQLTSQQQQQAMQSLSAYRNSVTQVNRSLDAMVAIKDYVPDGSSHLKPLELRGVTAQSAGIPIKNGMTIPVPSAQQHGGSGSTFTKGTNKLEGPDLRNPGSSADGYGQFTKSTWLSVYKSAFPEEAKGMNEAQILNLRHDKPTADRMIEAYKMQNASKLEAAGIHNPDEAELYMAHHFGAEGAIKLMNAPLRAPLESLLPKSVIDVNPDLKGKTPLDLYKKYSTAFTQAAG